MSPIAASAATAPEVFKKDLRLIAISPPPERFSKFDIKYHARLNPAIFKEIEDS
jgi:hypothetical protein